MARGEAQKTRVHLKGDSDDFVVFIDDFDTFKSWKADKSIPLAHFISTFKIFCTNGQGAQGTYNAPSTGTLENEFGTADDETVITKILEGGTCQDFEMPERQGPTNDSFSSVRAR